MTKVEKYWVFGMIYMLSAWTIGGETTLTMVAMVLCTLVGTGCLLVSAWAAIKSKP